jgi:hypothetical protein
MWNDGGGVANTRLRNQFIFWPDIYPFALDDKKNSGGESRLVTPAATLAVPANLPVLRETLRLQRLPGQFAGGAVAETLAEFEGGGEVATWVRWSRRLGPRGVGTRA